MENLSQKSIYKIELYLTSLIFVLSVFIFVPPPVSADVVDDLKTKISERSIKINELEQEIEEHQKDLEEVGKEKNTLQSALRSLDISQKKIGTNIRITENRIDSTSLQISKLAFDITDKEKAILLNRGIIAESIRKINEIDSDSFIETLLGYDNFSDAWEQVDTLQQFQTDLRHNLSSLKELKGELVESKDERELNRRRLLNYSSDLGEQNIAVAINTRTKSTLLTQTKNKESNYQTLLDEKVAARKQFEDEMRDLESQLQIAIDPNSIPSTGKGVLAWPLNNVRITQRFGNTAFAKGGAYDGRGHNGVDFGSASGSQVKAVLNGTVVAHGNTDAVKGCYSYGKWVLLEHPNGLSSVYGHLSGVNVTKGQRVVTGQTIAFSGNTGYSTGPHLHLSVLATQGVNVVRIGDIKKITNCADAVIPVAPHEAYLDPLSFIE